MLLCVCINPSLDYTVTLTELQPGETHRVVSTRIDPGGKALNVARVAAQLGIEVGLCGFLYEDDFTLFSNVLKAEGIANHCIVLKGKTRTNIKIRDLSTRQITELNQAGMGVTPMDIISLEQKLLTLAPQASHIVFSGGLPSECPSDTYARLIFAVRGYQAPCILDASGAALEMGVHAHPQLIKTNLPELEGLIGAPLLTRDDVARAAQSLLAYTDRAVVSMGADGAYLVTPEKVLFSPPLPVLVNSTVGAGDAMIAGLVAAWDQTPSRMLRLGVACASASVTMEGSTPPSKHRILTLFEKTLTI